MPAATKTQTRKSSTRKAPAAKTAPVKVRKDSTGKPNAAACGFPQVYLSDNGRFRSGLDARAKSDLRAAITGKTTGKELHTFTKAQATKLAASRDWKLV